MEPNSNGWTKTSIALLIAFLVAAGGSYCANVFDRSPKPGSVEIRLSEVGVVADFQFEVRRRFPHWFSLNFWFPEGDEGERARVRKLLGGHMLDIAGKPLEPGTPTPVELKIFRVCKDDNEFEIYSHAASPILTSWGQGYFGKNIGNHVLAAGTYRARLINKRASREFLSVPMTFEIFMPAKVEFDPKTASAGIDQCAQQPPALQE